MMVLLTIQAESDIIRIIDHNDHESYKQILIGLGYNIEKCKIINGVRLHPFYMMHNGKVTKIGIEKET